MLEVIIPNQFRAVLQKLDLTQAGTADILHKNISYDEELIREDR